MKIFEKNLPGENIRKKKVRWKYFLKSENIEEKTLQVKMVSSASGQDVYPHRGVLIRYSAQVIIITIIINNKHHHKFYYHHSQDNYHNHLRQGCPVPGPPSDGHLVGVNSSVAQLSCRFTFLHFWCNCEKICLILVQIFTFGAIVRKLCENLLAFFLKISIGQNPTNTEIYFERLWIRSFQHSWETGFDNKLAPILGK